MLTRLFALRQWIYLPLAIVLTWPLALHLPTHLPLGAESAATVPMFNLWTLQWNADRLQALYAHYWHAPIFHDETGAFAFSDPQPLTGLLFAPIEMISGNPVLAYNLVLLLILTLNGIAAYHLLRGLDIDDISALLGGALVVGLPFVFRELGVIQLTVLFPVLFALRYLYAFTQTTTLRHAVGLGLAIGATFLTSSFYGLFLSMFLLISPLFLLRRDHFQREALRNFAVAVLIAVALLAPVVPSQARLTARFSRSTETISNNSAEAVDYLRLDTRTLGHDVAPWLQTSGGSGQRLYPGTGLLTLAIIGLISTRRTTDPRWINFLRTGIVVAVLISFGLKFNLGEWLPYQTLRDFYPGLRQMRSPFRMAVFAQLFLLIFAGYGLARLWRWRALIGRGLVIVIVTLGMTELLFLPARLHEFPSDLRDAAWVMWLAQQDAGAVAMLPLPGGGRVREFEFTVESMLQSLEHGHPLVNGYSGLFPSSYREMTGVMNNFPNQASLELLRERGVTHVVIDRTWFTDVRQERLREYASQLERVYADERTTIFRVLSTDT